MNVKTKNRSLLAYLRTHALFFILLAAGVCLMLFYELTNVSRYIVIVDPYEYYSYLPALFLDGDLSFVNKYPIGTPLMELPFFAAAHLLTLLFRPEAADGYSSLYHYAVGFSGIFYFAVGTSVLYRILYPRFSKGSAALTCVLLSAGTFLPLYATRYAGFSHIFTYAAGCIWLGQTLRLCEDPESAAPARNFIYGVLSGLLILLRNVNAFFLVFYLLYGLGGAKGVFRNHLKHVFSPARLAMNVAGGLPMVFLQLLKWKLGTGCWIMYSYEGETFAYLTSPKVWEVLLSPAKGLLLFCPVLILCVFGSVLLFRGSLRNAAAGTLAAVGCELAICACWWCWWFGGVYGQRTFIDVFCFLALPMCAFVSWIFSYAAILSKGKKALLLTAFFLLCAGLVILNAAYLYGVHEKIVSEWLSNGQEMRRALNVFWYVLRKPFL